jgi:vacuolar-type H+-ATPase subunit E/Vma4
MSAEQIIARIKHDADQEVQQIKNEAKQEAEAIKQRIIEEAEQEASDLIEQGKKNSENKRRIILSKAHKQAKDEIMNAKEDIISDCFTTAKERLVDLSDTEYKTLIDTLITQAKTQIPGTAQVYVSSDRDKPIVKNHDLKILGSINAIGGIILVSEDQQVTIDNTFEGILKREQNAIRIKVGNILFKES